MNRLFVWLPVVVSAALLATAATPHPTTIPVEEIRPGMRGYGLSVLRGTEPEKFDVEVIDVLHNFRPDQDLILIRTPHPLLNRARGVGGMSGSPIYLDGRLAGAYAYGWQSSTDPIVGVTPIKSMLAELKRPIVPSMFPGSRATSSFRQVSSPHAMSRPPVRRFTPPARDALAAVRELASTVHARNGAENAMYPVQTPFAVGGLSEAVVREVADWFTQLGLTALAGSGGSDRRATNAVPEASDKFVAGGSIAVALATGDISLTGVGTVTHVTRDGTVLAFGHPMVNLGPVGLPTATSRVLHVLVSDVRSFKIAEMLKPLGLLAHDQQSAIVVAPDLEPAWIPVRVKINGVPGAQRTEWNVRIASHRAFSPMLVFTIMLNAITATANSNSDTVYQVSTKLRIDGHSDMNITEVGFTREGVASANALQNLAMFSMINAVYGNPFENSHLTGVDVTLTVTPRSDVLQIESASVEATEVDPGSTVPVYVRTREIDGKPNTFVMNVPIPEAAAGSDVQVIVASGAQIPVSHAEPKSLDDMLAASKPDFSTSSIVAAVQSSTPAMQIQGRVLRGLPDSVANALTFSTQTTTIKPVATEQHTMLALDRPVFGSSTFRLKVREIAKGSTP